MLAEEKKQFADDQQRRNAVEGKIGEGKRRYGLDLIREKLATTSGSAITLDVLVMNLEKFLELLYVLSAFRLQLLLGHRAVCGSHVALLNNQPAAA